MITLTADAQTVTLPVDLKWTDEHEWQPVEQTVSRTLTGALIVEAAARAGGRPITLAPDDESSAWMSLADLTAIDAWAAIPGKVLQLSMRGITWNVMFRHHDTSGITSKPLIHFNAPNTDDFYLTTIRLMEI